MISRCLCDIASASFGRTVYFDFASYGSNLMFKCQVLKVCLSSTVCVSSWQAIPAEASSEGVVLQKATSRIGHKSDLSATC